MMNFNSQSLPEIDCPDAMKPHAAAVGNNFKTWMAENPKLAVTFMLDFKLFSAFYLGYLEGGLGMFGWVMRDEKWVQVDKGSGGN